MGFLLDKVSLSQVSLPVLSFPCQYHSTNAPYPFIHLPLTLYNVSLPVLQFSLVSIIPPMLRTHWFTYHPRYIMFLSQYFSFPCQYHSTNAPYPFIHLPPTLYNVSVPVLQFYPVSIIPPMLYTHSFTYHPRYIMFLSQYFSFPCQYQSTNAPYPFIHLPPTLYNVSVPVLSFPLSIPFHQCSIPIHSPTTQTI